MDDSTIVKIVAIIALMVLETVNLVTVHIDGSILVAVTSAIAGIAGYEFGKRKKT